MAQGLPTTAKADLEDLLQAMTDDGGPVSEALARLNATALTGSGLDERTALLTRLAALVALDASPASYLVHLRLAEDAGIDPATIRAVLVELAPLVGTARIISAADKAVRAASGI
jgi:alkylhydroperoxidase/carboxymuconolactone decarboxylase family protein YurZ